jgi:aspartate aminotransferase
VVVINAPGNPSGTGYTPDELHALADVVADHPGVLVFADEIYEKLIYGDYQFVSFASLRGDLFDRILTFNCHSKSFAMTGWRLGYVAGPQPVIEAINKLQSQISSHVTSFIQHAGAAALTDPRGAGAVERMRAEFEHRGQHMWSRLNRIGGITCVRPTGAFYCFANVSRCFGRRARGRPIDDAIAFADSLLEHAHVAVVPGNDSGFSTHVRLSFATSLNQIDLGLDRIEAFVNSLE